MPTSIAGRVPLRLFLFAIGLALPLEAVQETEPYLVRKNSAIQSSVAHSSNALVLLQDLLKENPRDADVLFRLGMVQSDHARNLDQGPGRHAAMIQARETIIRAREAGAVDPIIATFLAEVNADGTENMPNFSNNPKSQQLMAEAEHAFAKRDMAQARSLYGAALKLEPQNYAATIYLGDTYFTEANYADALIWFQKAIVLDPNQEKAYRYSGDALLRLNRKDDALDQYLLAVVAQPHSQYSWTALQNGCRTFLLKPWVAAKNVPYAQVKAGKKGPEIFLPGNFTNMQVIYTLARSKWQSENKDKVFPAGQNYRQTLDEEVFALSTLIKIYHEMKTTPAPSGELAQSMAEAGPSIEELAEIEQAGLLEAHVLFFRTNEEVSLDYPAYREKNREKLRTYLTKHYLHLP